MTTDKPEKPDFEDKIDQLVRCLRFSGHSTFTYNGEVHFISAFLDQLKSRIKELEGTNSKLLEDEFPVEINVAGFRGKFQSDDDAEAFKARCIFYQKRYNSDLEDTKEILTKMGFENPNDNVWKSEWFGVFLLAKTATPKQLAQFIYDRGFNKGTSLTHGK